MMRREREAVRSKENVLFCFVFYHLLVIFKEGRDIYESPSGCFKLSCSIVLYPLWRFCACPTQTVSQRVMAVLLLTVCCPVSMVCSEKLLLGIQGEIHWKRGLKIETEKGHRDKPRGQFKGKKKRERTSKIGGLNLSPFTGPRAS